MARLLDSHRSIGDGAGGVCDGGSAALLRGGVLGGIGNDGSTKGCCGVAPGAGPIALGGTLEEAAAARGVACGAGGGGDGWAGGAASSKLAANDPPSDGGGGGGRVDISRGPPGETFPGPLLLIFNSSLMSLFDLV